MTWIQTNWGLIATMLWVTCELLNQMSSIKANSVLELVITSLESLLKGQEKLPPQ